MTVLQLMDWLEMTWISSSIKDSLWLFPVIESVHLLGLALLGGSVLVGDLRLIGWSIQEKPAAQVLTELNRWFLAALALMLITGISLFISEALKCYYSEAFWVKMITLVLAVTYTLAFRNPFVINREHINPWLLRAIGVGSISLWFIVAAAGRWIGFS